MSPKDAIVKSPNKVLRRRAEEVRPHDIPGQKIQRLIADMKEILAASTDGVGLAAPQVGVPLRIFIVSSEAAKLNANPRMDVPRPDGRDGGLKGLATNDTNKKKEWEYFVFINPMIKKHSQKKNDMAEGCLSLPGKFGIVKRAEKVFLEWLDERGRKNGRGFTKFFARVIQHEMDHLDGILISNRAKKLITAAVVAMEKQEQLNK